MGIVYIFLDEGGNFDFSPSGTTYFTLASATRRRPFKLNAVLDDYKYDLIEFGQERQHFHCSEDNAHVREQVFQRILEHHIGLIVDSLVVEKRKTGPALQEPRLLLSERTPRVLVIEGEPLALTILNQSENAYVVCLAR